MKISIESRIVIKIKDFQVLNMSLSDLVCFHLMMSEKSDMPPDLKNLEFLIEDKSSGKLYVSPFANAELCNHNSTIKYFKTVSATFCGKCNGIIRVLESKL